VLRPAKDAVEMTMFNRGLEEQHTLNNPHPKAVANYEAFVDVYTLKEWSN
jgi:hypothetical protein